MTARASLASLGLLAATALTCSPAMAEGSLSVEATIGRQLYDSNIEWVQAVGEGDLNNGWIVRAAAGVAGYQFNDRNSTVRATAPEISLGFGYAWSGDDWSIVASVSPGLEYTATNPRNARASQRGTQGFVRPEVSASFDLTPSLTAQLDAGYSLAAADYRVTMWLGYKITEGATVGPAFSTEAGPNSHQNQIGAKARFTITEKLELQVGAGYVNHGAYGLVGFTTSY
jgi:hypothetical protein